MAVALTPLARARQLTPEALTEEGPITRGSKTSCVVTTTLFALAMLACVSPGAASAAPTGGVAAPVAAPRVRAVKCLPQQTVPCPPRRALPRGGKALLRGSNLDAVRTVIFRGHRAPRDDKPVSTARASSRSLVVEVPRGAHAGPLTLVDQNGPRVTTRRVYRIASAEPVAADLEPGAAFFYDSQQRPTIRFTARDGGAVGVKVVDLTSGTAVRAWTIQVSAGEQASVQWRGDTNNGPPKTGRYRFELDVTSGQLVGIEPLVQEPFVFADHMFPIRGRHDLGQTATNGFGGGRNHKGQDMFARCDTRLVAARGGKVEYAGYHSAAGNYVVIDGTGTDVDYVYMHMRNASPVHTGERVWTGQEIGEVGETGRATGCHLHFEMWSSPGWYAGGRPFDPLPSLTIWDRQS